MAWSRAGGRAVREPNRGVVRFENRDGAPHHAIAFPLRPRHRGCVPQGAAGLGERAVGALLAGPPYTAASG